MTKDWSYDTTRQAERYIIGTGAVRVTAWFQSNCIFNGESQPQRPVFGDFYIAENRSGLTFSQGWHYSKFDTLFYDPDFSLLLLLDEPIPTSEPLNDRQAILNASSPTWMYVVIVVAVVAAAAGAILLGIFLSRRREAGIARRLAAVGEAARTSAQDQQQKAPARSDSQSARKSESQWRPASVPAD